MTDDPFDLLVEAIDEWRNLERIQQYAGKGNRDRLQENVDLAEIRARQLAKECP